MNRAQIRERCLDHYAAFARVSRQSQLCMRSWLPYIHFSNPEQFATRESAYATLVYARLNQKIRPSVEGGDGRIKIVYSSRLVVDARTGERLWIEVTGLTRLVEGSVLALPFAAGSFDVVVCCRLLQKGIA